jgi:hypothetical protein
MTRTPRKYGAPSIVRYHCSPSIKQPSSLHCHRSRSRVELLALMRRAARYPTLLYMGQFGVSKARRSACAMDGTDLVNDGVLEKPAFFIDWRPARVMHGARAQRRAIATIDQHCRVEAIALGAAWPLQRRRVGGRRCEYQNVAARPLNHQPKERNHLQQFLRHTLSTLGILKGF